MSWRLIELETGDAIYHMAREEAVMRSVDQKLSDPTIIIFKFSNKGGITFGYDKDSSLINKINCEEDKIICSRRRTGGNFVYHHPDDLTYSIIAPQELIGTNSNEKMDKTAYQTICNWIMTALLDIGLKTEFYGKNDIVIPKSLKKVVGNAQFITKNKTILQHGSLFYNAQPELWKKYLNIDEKQLEGIQNISKLTGKTNTILYETLLNALTTNKIVNGDFYIGELSDKEKKDIRELIKKTYSSLDKKSGLIRKGTACVIDLYKP